MITPAIKPGTKVRVGGHTHSDGSVISFTATVTKVCADYYVIRVPDRIRSLPFPFGGGKQADGRGPKYVRMRYPSAPETNQHNTT